MKESVQNIVNERIEKTGRGSFFFGQDFADVGTPEAVRKVLQRLEKAGTLLRIAPGIYYYPKIDTEYGLGVLYPSMSEIAEAIAKRDRATIVPTGAYALNMLGLSTQVPANAVFRSSGSTRCVAIGEGKGIQFVHTSSVKKLSFQSRLMMLIVSALREIGKDQVTKEQLAVIKEQLSHVSKEDYDHDIQLAPAWVRKTLHIL
ncbi:MAG: hypothetical protein J6P73_08820 [Bacteroidales bacterium]|nr:hypothetical protein [Bacteroidales bacterium]